MDQFKWFFLLLIWVIPGQAQFPGLFEADGQPHPVHLPNPVTGRTLNVVAFGADTLDNAFDDLPAILNALQNAQFGDEIYFPAGVYNLNSVHPGDSTVHLIWKSGVNLRGEGISRTILRSGFGSKKIDRFIKLAGINNVVVLDITLTAAFSGSYSTNPLFNNPAAGGPRYVISIEASSGIPGFNITIENVLVENFRTMGVRLSNSHDVVVRDCIFQKATDVGGGGAGYGVSIQGNGETDNDSQFNLITGNRFLGPYLRHGILLQFATHNNLIQNNYLNNCQLDAIDLHGEDEYLNEIRENEIRNIANEAAIGVGNSGSTHDAAGPFNYIHHNIINNCKEGIRVYLGSPDTRIEFNEIFGSTFGNGKGIFLLNAPRTIVKGNRIFDNSGNSFTGILLDFDNGTGGRGSGAPRDISLIENVIFRNDYGVQVLAGENIIFENNEIFSNRIANIFSQVPIIVHKRLTIEVQGNGVVDLNPPGGSYRAGSMVVVSALPDSGWFFSHWEGDLNTVDNPDSILIDDNKFIRAVFVSDPDSLPVTLEIRIKGEGRVQQVPKGNILPRNTLVNLLALPDSGWQFLQWTGDHSGADPSATIRMNTDKVITAIFDRITALGEQPVVIYEYKLEPNIPNPFNAETLIRFSLGAAGRTLIEIFDINGRKVHTLIDAYLSAGHHRFRWNASRLATGVYVIRLQSVDFMATRKILLVK